MANIRLIIEDGPLLQIWYSKTALEVWKLLKNLYSLKGFSLEFLICKELFKTTLSKYSSMEEYLNKVKQLTDQLKAKGIEMLCKGYYCSPLGKPPGQPSGSPQMVVGHVPEARACSI